MPPVASTATHLKFFAGDEKYPGTDIFPAALSPRGVLRGTPLTQFEGRGQGPGQPYRGTYTVGEPLRLVGIQRALNPGVLIQLRRRRGMAWADATLCSLAPAPLACTMP